MLLAPINASYFTTKIEVKNGTLENGTHILKIPVFFLFNV
jgi:hypothetical protein